jgi:anti-anti-sigma regulatory factor
MPANLQTICEGDVIIFKVWTDLLSSTLQDAVNQSLYRDYRKFVLDLKDVPRLAMGDVSVILSAWTSIRAKSGEMVLVPSPNDSMGLIDKMRLTSLLATYSTVEAAVKSFYKASRSA